MQSCLFLFYLKTLWFKCGFFGNNTIEIGIKNLRAWVGIQFKWGKKVKPLPFLICIQNNAINRFFFYIEPFSSIWTRVCMQFQWEKLKKVLFKLNSKNENSCFFFMKPFVLCSDNGFYTM